MLSSLPFAYSENFLNHTGNSLPLFSDLISFVYVLNSYSLVEEPLTGQLDKQSAWLLK